MNVIRCTNGHFFDGDSYDKCPHCGAAPAVGTAAPAVAVKEEKKGFWGKGRKEKESAAAAQPVIQAQPVNFREEFGDGSTPTDVLETNIPQQAPVLKKNPTLDFWQTSSHSENGAKAVIEEKLEAELPASEIQPEQAEIEGEVIEQAPDQTPEQEPVQETPILDAPTPASTPEPVSSLREAVKNASASSDGKTMSYFSAASAPPVASGQSQAPADPVVGWLVAIAGRHLGDSFCIYAGKNSIGRSADNRIVIPNDNSVSRNKHALIVYEPKKRVFYLQPGDSSGLTYLNEEYITESHKLSEKDIIELGESNFMFIPLCGESFSWEEHMPKGE